MSEQYEWTDKMRNAWVRVVEKAPYIIEDFHFVDEMRDEGRAVLAMDTHVRDLERQVADLRARLAQR